MGPGMVSWLMHCATSRTVPGFFPWLHPTEPCSLGSTQPLKMSTRDLSWAKGGRCLRLTTYHPSSAKRQENPEPLGPTRLVAGWPLPLPLQFKI